MHTPNRPATGPEDSPQRKVDHHAARGQAQIEQTKHELKQKSQEAAEHVKEEVTQLASDAQQATRRATRRAKQKGEEAVQRQKTNFANSAESVQNSLSEAAGRLREEKNENVADWVEAAGDTVGDMASYLKQNDLNSMLNHLEQRARRRPELVFGGMLLAGLATARFLKSSRRDSIGTARNQQTGQQEAATQVGSTSYASNPVHGGTTT